MITEKGILDDNNQKKNEKEKVEDVPWVIDKYFSVKHELEFKDVLFVPNRAYLDN